MPRSSRAAVASGLTEQLGSLARASELGAGAGRAVAGAGAGAIAWRPGWPELDRALPGGVPRGQVTEWAGPRSAGKTAALRQLVRAVREVGAGAAYVDGTGTLTPAPWAGGAAGAAAGAAGAVGAAGAMRPNPGPKEPPFWVVRPPGPVGVLAAAEELLRSGVFGLVIAEGADWSRTPVVRLQRLARESGAALVAVVDRAGRVPMAGFRVEFSAPMPLPQSASSWPSVPLPLWIHEVEVPAGLDSYVRRYIQAQGHGPSREVAYAYDLPYRLPEDSGFPDRRASAV